MSDDLATKSPEQELQELEAQAVEEQREAFANDSSGPLIVKVAQGTTRELPEGVSPGQLFSQTTGENLGTETEVIFFRAYETRTWRTDENELKVATGRVVPWPEHPCYGQLFSECPDAEERFKARANAGEVQWGKGPPIATSMNLLGLRVEDPEVPVRFIFARSQKKVARNIRTLVTASVGINRPLSEAVIRVAVERQSNKRGDSFYGYAVSLARAATVEERLAAARLNQQAKAFVEAQAGLPAEAPAPALPSGDSDGGLDV